MRLLGRQVECEALDRLLADAVAGTSQALVLRGEAGVGKTALLGYLSERVGEVRACASPGRRALSPRWSSPTAACINSA